MARIAKLKWDVLVIAAFALAAIAFYWPAIGGGQILLPLDNLWTIPPWVGPPDAIPHNRLIGDMILENYPWKLILNQALHQHELPLWNPYEMTGLPFMATGQTGALYPFTALFFIFGPLKAYGWYSALHQFLAATLTYLFVRRLGIGRFGSAVAGLVFAFSFFLTVSYIWPMVLGAAVWLPLALWSLLGLARAAARGSFGRALAFDLPIGAAAIALSVLGGHLEITFYATFAVALYGLYLAGTLWFGGKRGESGRFILAAGVAISLGVLLASVQLVPFLEVLRGNNRQGETTYQQVISYALPHRQILGLLMPDYFGNPTAHDYFDLTTLRWTEVGNNALGQGTDPPHTIFWGTKNYVEAGGYVGVVPLLLAFVGLLLGRPRDRWFFAGLAALSLLLAFGTPLYALIYYGLPFFSQLRTPFRWLFLFDFAIAILAGLGANQVLAGPKPRIANPLNGREPRGSASSFWSGVSDPRRLGWWLPALVGVMGLAALCGSLLLRGRSVAFAGRFLARDPELQRAFGSAAMLYSYEFRNLAIFFALLTVGGIVVAVGLSLARDGSAWTALASTWKWPIDPQARRGASPEGRPGTSRLRVGIAVLLLGCVVGDLFYFGVGFASKEPAAILNQRTDLSSVLPANPAGPRVVSLGDPIVLPSNLGVILGVPSVGGYDTIISADFVRLWSLIEPPVDLPYNQIGRLHQVSSLTSPVLDLLGVRYVLTETPITNPAVRLAGQFGAIKIYERPTALPRAFVVSQATWVTDQAAALRAVAAAGFQPNQQVVLEGPTGPVGGGHGTATIESYQLDRAIVNVNSDGPAYLVLADANAAGWQATIDGAATTVFTADGYVRAVPIPAGSHRIVFSYSPLSLRLGAYLSFLAAIVLGLIATQRLWRGLTGHYGGQAERVLRNSALPLFTSFLNKAIDFGFAALMLRILGATSVGEYTDAIVLMGFFDIFTNFGLNTLIIREVARDRQQAGRYLADTLTIRLGLCVIAAPVVGVILLLGHGWLNLTNQGILAFVLLTLGLIPGNVTGALSALFNAWERNDLPALVTVATTLLRVTISTAALLAGAGIIGLAALSLALNVILVIVFLIAARQALALRLTGPVPADLPEILAESLPLFLNNVLVTVFFKIDVLLLQAFKGSETVGYYATAYKWIDGFLIIPSTFTFAIYPALSRLAKQPGQGIRNAYEVSIRILVCVAIPIAVAIAFLSGDLILLLGGPAYYPASAQALTILIWFLPFSYVNGLTQYALIAVNRQRFITLAFFVAAAFNVIANLILIPTYSFYAASAVTVLSEVVLMVPFMIGVRRYVGWPNWLGVAGKPAIAGILMVLVTATGRWTEPHLALVVGGLVYVGAIWTLGVFSPNELAVLRRIVLRPKSVVAIA